MRCMLGYGHYHSGTSVVLNVAEGNGRYSELDHRRFLEVAAASAVKAARLPPID